MSYTIAMKSILRRSTLSTVVAPRYSTTRLYSSTMHDNDAVTLDREKQKNLSNKQHKSSSPHDHAPGWNEILASESEAHVKADKDGDIDVERLTKRTIELVKHRHHADDLTIGTEAVYEKDEIEGPLKSASSKSQRTPSEEIIKAMRGEK